MQMLKSSHTITDSTTLTSRQTNNITEFNPNNKGTCGVEINCRLLGVRGVGGSERRF